LDFHKIFRHKEGSGNKTKHGYTMKKDEHQQLE
jgi:hypothetical protein